MDEQEINPEEFDLESIIREFSDSAPAETEETAETPQETAEETAEPEPEEEVKEAEPEEETAESASEEEAQGSEPEVEAAEPAPEEEAQEAEPGEETAEAVPEEDAASGDTIRMDAIRTDAPTEVTGDTIRMDVIPPELLEKTKKQAVRDAQPVEEMPQEQEGAEPFSDQWEPEYEQPMGEYVPPQPLVFRPRSRLRELKRQLVEGPEKQYYMLVDKGLGKVQVAIFISVLTVLISAGATALFALGMVQENRLRLMVFGQFFAMLVAALLGSYQLIDGVSDLLKKQFSLNSLLVCTFVACVVDGVFCLRQLRVPCCAAFSLEVTMSLWSSYQKRNVKIGMLDTMRKATQLDSLGEKEEFYEERSGLLRGEGRVEDFMETYEQTPQPEKTLDRYALIALCASVAVAIVGGVMHGVAAAFQVLAAALLASVPATMFITVSRPFAVLERKLHALGTVLCGWQAVETLSKKQIFPLSHTDFFPVGSVKMNGVKFFGDREPDEVVAYCTALVTAAGNGLAPLFEQVLESRNGAHYDATQIQYYEGNGIGGVVDGETVLVGSLPTLRTLGVSIPDGMRVSQAVCVAIEGRLCGLFALSYDQAVSSAAGLTTLSSYRGLNPMLACNDVLLDEEFIQKKFGIKTGHLLQPPAELRSALGEQELPEENRALLLVTKDGLAPYAFGVTGARTLRAASRLGAVIHMVGGGLGIAIVLVLAILGALDLVTPANMFLYQLAWMIPGVLITEWTRTF